MTAWYRLTPTNDAFLDAAPLRVVKIVNAHASSEALWSALEADDAIVGWSKVVTAGRWHTMRPFGVGAEREITLGGILALRERFYRWDQGRRMTFSVSEASVPMFSRFAEDFQIEPTPEGSRLTWTTAIEPVNLLRPVGAVLRPLLSLALSDLVRGLRNRL